MRIGERPVGSAGGARAEAYVESVLKGFGYKVSRAEYPCSDWRLESCSLRSGGDELPAIADPFSPSVRAEGEALFASSLDEIRGERIESRILVLGPELCGFPIMPKAFDYFNPEEHRVLVALIEAGRPAAVVAVSPQAEGVWPIFADPDLAVPSVTVPSSAAPLVASGSRLDLAIEATTRPSSAATISGVLRRGPAGSRRRLLCAHLDTKHYTPGALDNGGCVAALLAAAELAAARGGPSRAAREESSDLEIVFFMGEECNAYGEKTWLAARGGSVSDIAFAMNCDGAGGILGARATALSFFNFPDEAKNSVMKAASHIGRFTEMAPWYEGDHYLFWPAGIPTIAATSADPQRFARFIHTAADLPRLVDLDLLAELAELVAYLVREQT